MSEPGRPLASVNSTLDTRSPAASASAQMAIGAPSDRYRVASTRLPSVSTAVTFVMSVCVTP